MPILYLRKPVPEKASGELRHEEADQQPGDGRHEPLHGGFVGYGMLDAACPGEVFTSPVPDQMLVATQAVNGGWGAAAGGEEAKGEGVELPVAAGRAWGDGIAGRARAVLPGGA